MDGSSQRDAELHGGFLLLWGEEEFWCLSGARLRLWEVLAVCGLAMCR